MVRITGRMSGTGFGTVVLQVAPESAVGGPEGCDYDFLQA
jgi:dihydroxyacid dehydratase/phosphogluconate dehydratase